MNSLRAIAFVVVCFITSSATTSFAEAPKLCGDIHTIKPVPLSQSPYQFKMDSDLEEVYLLPSPNGRYIAVLRHGACDSTYMGIWDKIIRRAYGDETVSMMYGVKGVCWDPMKPAVYFFYESEGGYPEDEAGIYKWEFEKRPDEPQQLDSSAIVKRYFKRDSIDASLVAIGKDSKDLLLNIDQARNGEDIGYDSYLNIGKNYIFDMINKAFVICEKCNAENWERKKDQE